MKFDDYKISPDIKKRIKEFGYKKPTDIQYKSIPSILNGEDVLAIAQTGTGKTAAYVIPILDMVDVQKMKSRVKGIKCLVMVPTRELAVQIKDVFNDFGRYTKVSTYAVFGGVEQDNQIARLEKEIDILVATPGRMFDLISQGHINIERIKILVIDEADLMLSRGFLKDIQDVQKHIPKWRQTLFFSATIDDNIKKLAYSLVVNPIRIQLSPKDPVAKNVSHFMLKVGMDDKRYFLEQMVRDNPNNKILVFARTKVRVERIHNAMKRVNIESLVLHGDVDQRERLNILNQFKEGKTDVLIATDVSSRGIDIPNVHLVINYDLPDEADTYVHRVGRTGRGRMKGIAYSFCSPEEKEKLKAIEEYITKPINEIKIDKASYNAVLTFTEEKTISMKSLTKMVEEMEEQHLAAKKKNKKKKK